MSRKTTCRCGGVRINGRCERCNASKQDHCNKSSTQRGYGYDWQQLRARVLAEQPLCEACDDRVTPATEVHHKRAIRDAPHLRIDRANLMSVCRECHEKLEKLAYRHLHDRGG